MPTFPPLHSSLVGFGELSITASQVVKMPLTGSQSAGVWGVAATDTEMTALKAAGPKQTAGVVAYGGSTSAAIAAEISPNNTTGQVVSLVAQGKQIGLKAQCDSGSAVMGTVTFGGNAIHGVAPVNGGFAGYFDGSVYCGGKTVVNAPFVAGDTRIDGSLSVNTDITVNATSLVTEIANLQAAVKTLQGQVAGLLAK
jgi:hypothetical protein